MELTKVVCTSCGNSLQIDQNNKTQMCDACGSTFLVSHGLEFALKGTKEHKQIAKLRDNLKRAVDVDDHKNILHFTKEILRLIPKDDLANYYYAYANYKFGARRYLLDFYERVDFAIPDDLIELTSHIISYSDIRDKHLVEDFIAQNAPHKQQEYERVYNQKVIEEEHYSTIPRDVFISYRSTEQEIANQVIDTIESDGFTCWISSRNLRPNDNENYWTNIEDAITKASIFLVITSESAMVSPDVRRELDIAMKLKKARLEFKIDDTKHTSTFKYFFDGYKWIDAVNSFDEALKELRTRIYELLQDTSMKTTKQQEKIQKTQLDEYEKLLNRSEIELINNDFESAIDTCKDTLSLKPNASLAWWQLFLAENNFNSTEALNEFVIKKANLDKLMLLYQQSSYQQYKKYTTFTDGNYPKTIKQFEDALYEKLLYYINMAHLNADNKTSYIDAKCRSHILNAWNKLLTKYKFDTDTNLKQALESASDIDQLKTLFNDFTSIIEHPDYNRSHIQDYYTMFQEKLSKHKQQTTLTLTENQQLVEDLYEKIHIAFDHEDYEDVLNQTIKLFKYDNTHYQKYLYLLLATMKVNNTIDLYKAVQKFRKRKQCKLFESNLIQKLFEIEQTHELVVDLMMHCRHKKRKKENRITLRIGGDFHAVSEV
ncbi:MAG: toll/interleukin-1 receptor domain-containing protein [Candidatus Izimaplasma sp.]|nr:toll/interleukin-1 receptor domain-containing protein [Candidatus Izimaplasma bacterium]